MKFIDLYSVIEEANTTKREEYIRNKYGARLHDLLEKYITDSSLKVDEWFRATFQHDFSSFIVNEIDPFHGPYSEWIAKFLLKKDFNSNSFYRFLVEDRFKVREDLQKYHRYKRFFKDLGEELNNPNTHKLSDINNIKDDDDLYQKLKLLEHFIEQHEEVEELRAAERDVDKLYNSENYLVLIPRTRQASCAYGRNTRWCTASTGSYNYFDNYNRKGPLYIIIDKKNNKKYQFHFQTGQYNDENDHSVDLQEFVKKHAELKDVLFDAALANKKYSIAIMIDRDKVLERMESMSESDLKLIIPHDAAVAILFSKKHRELTNKSQHVLRFLEDGDVDVITTATELVDFVDVVTDRGHRSTSPREYAEKVLNGDVLENWNYESYYDDHMWDYMSDENVQNTIHYIKKRTGDDSLYIGDVDDLQKFLSENDDIKEDVHEAISYAFDDTLRNAVESAITEEVVDAIEGVIKEYEYVDGRYILKWKMKQLENVVNEISKNNLYQGNGSEVTLASWNSFFSEWTQQLENDDEEATYNMYAEGHPYSGDKNDKETFNESYELRLYNLEQRLNSGHGDSYSESYCVSNNMNNFDSFVSSVIRELNMSKGGISNQSGSTNEPSTSGISRQTPSVSSNPSTKVNQPKTTGTNSSLGQQGAGEQMFNPDEMDQLVLNKDTDFANLLQDPDTSTQVFQHVTSSLADPNYKNRVSLQNVLKNNQNFGKAYNDYVRQYKPLNNVQ